MGLGLSLLSNILVCSVWGRQTAPGSGVTWVAEPEGGESRPVPEATGFHETEGRKVLFTGQTQGVARPVLGTAAQIEPECGGQGARPLGDGPGG